MPVMSMFLKVASFERLGGREEPKYSLIKFALYEAAAAVYDNHSNHKNNICLDSRTACGLNSEQHSSTGPLKKQLPKMSESSLSKEGNKGIIQLHWSTVLWRVYEQSL